MKKKVIVGVLIIILMFATTIQVFAEEKSTGFDYQTKMTEMTSSAGSDAVNKPLTNMAGTAITVTQIIAIGVAIIMLLVLAMKYMISAPSDKATIKKHAVVYIVGAVIMFAATGILEIIKNFATIIS